MDRHDATPAGTRANTTVLAFTLVAGMVVFLRTFTRLFLTRGLGFEDVMIVLAMAFSIALAVMTSEQATHGLGKHGSDLSTEDREVLLRAFWANLWIYNLILTFTKVSILVQYLRLFTVRRFRKACFAVLGLVIACGTWAVFNSIFICNPIPFAWDKSLHNGHCLNQIVIWFTNAGINIAQDITIMLLPIPIIRTLQIPKGEKKGLMIMSVLGASVTLVSVIRLYSLDNIANSDDISFDNPAHAILSATEANVGIIWACLPAMRPLLALVLPKHFSTATQFTNVQVLDIEQPKHIRTQSSSTRTNTRPNTSRTNTPHIPTPHQVHRPTLSRTASGRFPVVNNGYPDMPPPRSINHSRTGSNVSSKSAAMKPSPARLQGRINPLAMSPISPPIPIRLSTISPLAPGSYTRKPNSVDMLASFTSPPLPPRTQGSSKPLPITPFPVGEADYVS